MEKLKQWIEKHPYISVGALLVGIIAIYLVSRSSSSSAAPTTSDATNAYDVQLAQLQAGESEANLQANAQLQAASIAAQSQTDQVNAQLAAVKDQDATQVSLATVETGAQTTQMSNKDSLYEQIYKELIDQQTQQQESNNNLALQQQQTQAQLEGEAITVSGKSGSHLWGLQDLEAVQGEQGALESNSQAQALESEASAFQTSSILGSIGNIVGGIL